MQGCKLAFLEPSVDCIRPSCPDVCRAALATTHDPPLASEEMHISGVLPDDHLRRRPPPSTKKTTNSQPHQAVF